MLRSTRGAMFSQGLGIVTALVNTACSCHSCNYHSWEGTCINHIILLNDRWVRQLVASEWCNISILGWWLINGALPWWNTTIMMCSKMGWIAKHVRSYCHRVKVVLLCVELLVYWKAIEGMAMLISRENPWILSVQSLEAHHCHSWGWCQQPFWGYLGSTYSTPDLFNPGNLWDNLLIPYSTYFPAGTGSPNHRTPPPDNNRYPSINYWDQPIWDQELPLEPISEIEEPITRPSTPCQSAWQHVNEQHLAPPSTRPNPLLNWFRKSVRFSRWPSETSDSDTATELLPEAEYVNGIHGESPKLSPVLLIHSLHATNPDDTI